MINIGKQRFFATPSGKKKEQPSSKDRSKYARQETPQKRIVKRRARQFVPYLMIGSALRGYKWL